jgi:uncharacterized protein
VVLVDANVLLYAVNDSMSRHASAKRWIEQALSGTEAVGFAWHVLLAFIRLATLRALFPIPLEADAALNLVDEWLGARPAVVVHPTARHASVLRSLLGESGTAGNLVSDAHLAALCIEHGARICSFDRDFNRFSGIRAFVPE